MYIAPEAKARDGLRAIRLNGSYAAVFWGMGLIKWFFQDWASQLVPSEMKEMQELINKMFPNPVPYIKFPLGQDPAYFLSSAVHPPLHPLEDRAPSPPRQPALVPLPPPIGATATSSAQNPQAIQQAIETRDAASQTDLMPIVELVPFCAPLIDAAPIVAPLAFQDLVPVGEVEPATPPPRPQSNHRAQRTRSSVRNSAQIGQARSPGMVALPECAMVDFVGPNRSLATIDNFNVTGVLFSTFKETAYVHNIIVPEVYNEVQGKNWSKLEFWRIMLAWEMFVYYILSTYANWRSDPFNGAYLAIFISALLGNNDCKLFEGAVNGARHQYIDGDVFANNLKNVRRWLKNSYEAFDRTFGVDTEVLKDFPTCKPLMCVGADSDDDFQKGNGEGTCSQLLLLH
jgi:hypothetical protein